jgi:predicted dehydrogenase
MNQLKTAVLGLNEQADCLLKAAFQTGFFKIAAVADKDAKQVQRVSAEYNCEAYDDYRQLVMNPFDCLLVSAALHTCDEYLRTAIKKKMHIFKLSPPARNFDEASEFAHLAERENVKFAISNPSRFAQSFLALRQNLQQGDLDLVLMITAVCNTANEVHPAWQTDPRLAGGGVLLCDCYDLLDQIVLNFGVPQQVYCLSASHAPDKKQRLYLTEDMAVITLKFTDTCLANLIASRTAGLGSEHEILKMYTKNKIFSANCSEFVVSNGAGQVSEQSRYEESSSVCLKKSLENFALSIILPDKNRLFNDAKENLNTMAVLEAAYLSARTSMPEEPNKILQMAASHVGMPLTFWPAQK